MKTIVLITLLFLAHNLKAQDSARMFFSADSSYVLYYIPDDELSDLLEPYRTADGELREKIIDIDNLHSREIINKVINDAFTQGIKDRLNKETKGSTLNRPFFVYKLSFDFKGNVVRTCISMDGSYLDAIDESMLKELYDRSMKVKIAPEEIEQLKFAQTFHEYHEGDTEYKADEILFTITLHPMSGKLDNYIFFEGEEDLDTNN